MGWLSGNAGLNAWSTPYYVATEASLGACGKLEKDFISMAACLSGMGVAMELRHLKYFIAVAETGSLTVAAKRRLHTSQPSLSRQIRYLEDQVRVELLSRGAHGVELTAAGKAFLDHARLALMQVDAAVEAARRAAQPARKTFAIGFQTGHEMNWLPPVMHVLRDELKNVEVRVSSDYSPDLAEALARGRLDLAFLRVEPGYDLEYRVVDREPLIVLMPSDHRLTAKQAIHPRELVGEIFIGGSNKATVLRAVTEDYLRRSGVNINLDHGVDNLAMAISLVASARGLALMPAYAKNLLPWSVVSRPLEGEAPTIDLAVGYSKTNNSAVLNLFLSRLDELIERGSKRAALVTRKGDEPS
jgi:LysR family hca operon transcriptional activator